VVPAQALALALVSARGQMVALVLAWLFWPLWLSVLLVMLSSQWVRPSV
jgi:hypothetical protein